VGGGGGRSGWEFCTTYHKKENLKIVDTADILTANLQGWVPVKEKRRKKKDRRQISHDQQKRSK